MFHLYGDPAGAMSEIKIIANKHKLFIIEDAAEAFGSKYKNDYVGTIGEISTISFFGNKTIITVEGGIFSTNNKILNLLFNLT